MKIALIMLAAGNSRRFGSNKLLCEIDGKPMYRHILEKLTAVAGEPGEEFDMENLPQGPETAEKKDENSASVLREETKEQGKEIFSCALETDILNKRKQEKTVTVVTQYEEIEEDARALGVRVYVNLHPDEGISSSLKIGLKANLDADACLFTVSDQPWLTAGTAFPARASLAIPVFLQKNIMTSFFPSPETGAENPS